MLEYKAYSVNELSQIIFEKKETCTIKYFDEKCLITVFGSRPTSKLQEITTQVEKISKNESYFLTLHNTKLEYRIQLTNDQKFRIRKYETY